MMRVSLGLDGATCTAPLLTHRRHGGVRPEPWLLKPLMLGLVYYCNMTSLVLTGALGKQKALFESRTSISLSSKFEISRSVPTVLLVNTIFYLINIYHVACIKYIKRFC